MKKTPFLLFLFIYLSVQGQNSNILTNVSNMSKYSKNIGVIYNIKVTGSKYGRLYGGYDGVYTDDSKLAAAAVHSGLLYVGETKTLRVKIVPGQNRYLGIKKMIFDQIIMVLGPVVTILLTRLLKQITMLHTTKIQISLNTMLASDQKT